MPLVPDPLELSIQVKNLTTGQTTRLIVPRACNFMWEVQYVEPSFYRQGLAGDEVEKIVFEFVPLSMPGDSSGVLYRVELTEGAPQINPN